MAKTLKPPPRKGAVAQNQLRQSSEKMAKATGEQVVARSFPESQARQAAKRGK